MPTLPGDLPERPSEDTLAEPAKIAERDTAGGVGDQGSRGNSREGGSREASAPRAPTAPGSETDSDDPGAGDFHKQRFMTLHEGQGDAVPPDQGEAADKMEVDMPIGPSVGKPLFQPSPLSTSSQVCAEEHCPHCDALLTHAFCKLFHW